MAAIPKNEEKRTQAMGLFMKSRGTASLSGLSKQLGVHRQTLARWKEEDKWDEKITAMNQSAAEKAVDLMSDKMANEIAKHFQIDTEHLDILDKIIFLQLIERDSNGQPVRGPDGLLRPNSKLTPVELQRVANTRHQVTTTKRLILGLSTSNENVSQKVHGKIETTVSPTARLEETNRLIIEIIQSGDADRLQALQEADRMFELATFGKQGKEGGT